MATVSLNRYFRLARLLTAGVIAAGCVVVVAAGSWFYGQWTAPVGIYEICVTSRQQPFSRLSNDPAERDQYWKCIDNGAKLFLDRDYAETKDLSKAFLTLLTAMLVASITFSEKIVDFARSGWWAKGSMIACWVLLLIAIATCGAGLALMTNAAGYAAYFPHSSFRQFERQAIASFIISGLSFGSALVALLIAGILSIVDAPSKMTAA